MNRNDAIKAVAEHLRTKFGGPAEAWMDDARSLADAGLLAIDPEPEREPLPVGTRKRSPEGVEAVLTEDGPDWRWMAYKGARPTWFTDKYVKHWDIIPDAPEASKATIDAESLARWLWNDIDTWVGTWVDWTDAAKAIRAWADEEGHRQPVPEGHVAIDMSGYSDWLMKEWATNRLPVDPLADAGVELARRGES